MTEERQTRTVYEELKRHIPPKGFAKIWAILSIFIIAASWAGWAWLAVSDHRQISELQAELAKYRTETVIEHHVAIIGRLEDGDFAFQSDEEPQGGAFRPCPTDIKNGLDVDGLLTQGIGHIADYAAWEERGVCKSILRADLGLWFRDKKNNFEYARVDQ
jgi:hypothetical protein